MKTRGIAGFGFWMWSICCVSMPLGVSWLGQSALSWPWLWGGVLGVGLSLFLFLFGYWRWLVGPSRRFEEVVWEWQRGARSQFVLPPRSRGFWARIGAELTSLTGEELRRRRAFGAFTQAMIAEMALPEPLEMGKEEQKLLRERMVELATEYGQLLGRRWRESEPLQVSKVVSELKEMWRRQGDDVEVLVDGPIPFVSIDPTELRRLLCVLVDNAVVHNPVGTGVSLLLSHDEAGGVDLQVHDDGDGIDLQLRSRIFAPFVTGAKARGGVGLGLTIAREIALAHRGSLDVLSSHPGGTIFQLKLPPTTGS